MRNKHQSGAILIVTLWMVSLLSALFVGTGFRLSIENRLSDFYLESTVAFHTALSGIGLAKDALSQDTNEFDSLGLCGITPPDEEHPDSIPAALGQAVAAGTLLIIDEERKINVNTAQPNVLRTLPDITEEAVAALLDWRDTDDDETEGGAENGYYQGLSRPYSCRNGALKFPEELLMVKGITPKIMASIKEHVTVYGDGFINLNTVSAETLEILGLTEELAAKIVAWRNGDDGLAGTGDDQIFRDKNKLDVPSLSPQQNAEFAAMKNLFKVQSSLFRVESRALLKNAKSEKTASVIFERDKDPKKLWAIYWIET